MSRFLGPIHLWLHNKIALQEEIELSVTSALAEKNYDLSVIEAFDAQYGLPNPSEQLENVIDTQNIHGWLANRIANAETRFAAKLTHLNKVYGEDVLETAKLVYSGYGESIGTAISESGRYDGSLTTAHKLLHDYVLEGMPCDRAGGITHQSDESLDWQSLRCLHESYWQLIGGSVQNHYVLRDSFSKSFFNTLDNIAYKHDYNESVHTFSINK